jgi:hypothetical protein
MIDSNVLMKNIVVKAVDVVEQFLEFAVSSTGLLVGETNLSVSIMNFLGHKGCASLVEMMQ